VSGGRWCAASLPRLEQKVAEIGLHMNGGKLESLAPGEFASVLGGGARAPRSARGAGDKVTLIAPQGLSPPRHSSAAQAVHPGGPFRSGDVRYDSVFALIHLEDAQSSDGMGKSASGVRLSCMICPVAESRAT